MDKKGIWVIVAIVVVALLAYLFVFKKTSAPSPSDTSVQGTSQSTSGGNQAQNSTTSPQSLKDLIAGGTSLKCTFSEAGNEGTMYVSGGKARGDFMASNQKGHMVMADQTSYIWMDGSSQGFKTSLANSTSTTTPPTGGSSQGVDSSKKMNYSCSPWSADASMFTPPASVQFLDASAMMKVPGQK